LTLGDKRTQKLDLKLCHDSISSLTVMAETWKEEESDDETDDIRES
jgi:hypothetical protein